MTSLPLGFPLPQILDVVGDPAADTDVHLPLPLNLLPPAVPVLILVLLEPSTQDLWLVVQDDDECTLDMALHPAAVVHNLLEQWVVTCV